MYVEFLTISTYTQDIWSSQWMLLAEVMLTCFKLFGISLDLVMKLDLLIDFREKVKFGRNVKK